MRTYLLPRRRQFVRLVFCLLLLAPIQLAHAWVIRLNAPLIAAGDVQDFAISPNGLYVVYRADQTQDESFNLYSVPIKGGTPVRLNRPLPANADVADFLIAPNSNNVIFRANYGGAQQFDLLRVPITGGTPITLNDTLVAGGSVGSYGFLPNSSRAVYLADEDTNDVTELYSADLAGNGVKLNAALAAGGDVSAFAISADSARVVYRADQDTDEAQELYSVQPSGAGRRKLNGALVANGDVGAFAIDALSERAIYIADQTTDGKNELYSAQIDAATPPNVTVSGSMNNNRDVTDFIITPAGTRVIFRADRSSDEVYELHNVTTTGTSPVQVSATIAITAGDVLPNGYAVSPNSARLLYLADASVDGKDELFSVPLGGGAAARINPAGMINAGDVVRFAISPLSDRVVYLADQDTDEKFDLQGAPVAGGAWVRLNLSPITADVLDFAISGDGRYVAFRATDFLVPQTRLEANALDGSAFRYLSAPLENGEHVAAVNPAFPSFAISSDSDYIAYVADHNVDDQHELFAVVPNLKTYLPLAMRGW